MREHIYIVKDDEEDQNDRTGLHHGMSVAR